MSLEQNLERVVARHAELNSLVAAHPEPGSSGYAEMLKEFAELTPVVEGIEELRRVKAELAGVESLLADPDSDAEMCALAQSERQDLQARIPALEQKLRLLLLPKDEADERNAIMEVRAGTGGDEASAVCRRNLPACTQRYRRTAQSWKFGCHLQHLGLQYRRTTRKSSACDHPKGGACL